MKIESLEKNINKFLQQKINISVNNKFTKSGKLILFCIKDFYLVFTILIQQTKKIVEIPYPFDYEIIDNKIILSYMVDKFCSNIYEVQNHVKLLTPRKPNKFFNVYAEISVVEDV